MVRVMAKKYQLKHAIPKEKRKLLSFFTGLLKGLLPVVAFSLLALFSLWMYALAPQMDERFQLSDLTEYDYAHRGLHNNGEGIPENSLQSFQLAADSGFGVELDLQLTLDNEVVVFHDESLLRLCGEDQKLPDLTLEDLQAYTLLDTKETIPTLEETLSAVAGRIPIIVEIKIYNGDPEQYCPVIWDALKDYEGLYCIQSFDSLAIKWFRENQPQVLRGQLMSTVSANEQTTEFQAFIQQNLCSNYLTRPDFTAYDCRVRETPAMWVAKNLFSMPEISWTVRDEETYRRLKDDNCIIIFEGFIPGGSLEENQRIMAVDGDVSSAP